MRAFWIKKDCSNVHRTGSRSSSVINKPRLKGASFFRFLPRSPGDLALTARNSSRRDRVVNSSTGRTTSSMPSTPPSALNDKQSPSSHLPPSLPNSPIAKRPKTRLMSANEPTAPSSSSNPTIPPVTAEPPLRVKFLSDKAKAPTRGSAFAAGYDLYAAEHCAIPAKGKALVGTSLAIVVPGGCCRYLGLCDQTFTVPVRRATKISSRAEADRLVQQMAELPLEVDSQSRALLTRVPGSSTVITEEKSWSSCSISRSRISRVSFGTRVWNVEGKV